MASATQLGLGSHSRRISSLDGLRGVAAVVVVLTHAMNLFPDLGKIAFQSGPQQEPFSLAWMVIYTPIHLFWEGTGAVCIFFVLSGIVLTVPVVRSFDFSWWSYYPSRFIRLYLPVWGAVVLGYLLVVAVNRESDSGNLWLESLPKTPAVAGAAKDLLLFFGPSGLISPLWSLRYEVLFSLLLPICIWLAVNVHANVLLKLGVALAITTAGGILGSPTLQFMPIFLLGVFLAVERDSIDKLAHLLGTAGWVATLGIGLLLLVSRWLVMLTSPPKWVDGATIGSTAIGALLIVFVVWKWQLAAQAFATRPVRWLGTVSFSLYLVHEPIILTIRYWLLNYPVALSAVLGVVVSIPAAILFYVAVERPSHRLSRFVGRLLKKQRPARSPFVK